MCVCERVREQSSPTSITIHTRAQARHWLTRVTDDEYDAALARTPDVCRPFAAAMGDRRPARQCLAEYPADARRTLADLAASPDGARRLALLAAAIEARLAR